MRCIKYLDITGGGEHIFLQDEDVPLKLDYSINAVYLDSIRINWDVTGFYSAKSEFISF